MMNWAYNRWLFNIHYRVITCPDVYQTLLSFTAELYHNAMSNRSYGMVFPYVTWKRKICVVQDAKNNKIR